MPTPVPLPKTWRLLSRIQCPSCAGWLNFNAGKQNSLEREMYCPNAECEQHGIIYEVGLLVDGLQVIGVKK
jgi:uncharacterized protein YbaR (Trm112 family)